MTEHETRCAVDECLEEACAAAIQDLQRDDSKIAEALLEHREQRFRLSYILGGWPQNQSDPEENESDYQFDTDSESTGEDSLAADEAVSDTERAANAELLRESVARIRKIAAEGRNRMMAGPGDFQDMESASQRQAWLDEFAGLLYEVEGFSQLSLDIMESIKERFDAVTVGEFERVADWPTIWRYEEKGRDTFLKQVRWFSSNDYRQFGRLLTPLVNGIRVCGAFYPAPALQEDDQRLGSIGWRGPGAFGKGSHQYLHQGNGKICRRGDDSTGGHSAIPDAGCPDGASEVGRQQRPRPQTRCRLHSF